MVNVNDIISLEKKIAAMVEEIKSDVCGEIASSTPDGVTLKGSNMATVSISTIMKNNLILSPEYYIPISQANLVQDKLSGVKSVTDFTRIVQEMCDTGYCKIGANRHKLNPYTVQILQKYIA